jgi:hypothetical protein
MNGSGSRLVISHPDAALYIQLPTFATTVAVQTTAKAGCRNGLQGEPTLAEAEDETLALISGPGLNRRQNRSTSLEPQFAPAARLLSLGCGSQAKQITGRRQWY